MSVCERTVFSGHELMSILSPIITKVCLVITRIHAWLCTVGEEMSMLSWCLVVRLTL